jgi:hypothetical protein
MSTKKKTVAKTEPEVITATQVEAQAKKTLKKETPIKKCNCASGHCLCGKKSPVKKEEKEYVVATLTCTKFKFDDKFKCKRVIAKIDVTSKEDLSNRPDDAEKLISDHKQCIAENGWSLNDPAALIDARQYVEHMLAAGAVEIEYGTACSCKRCLSERMRNLAETLRICRAVECKRLEVGNVLYANNGSDNMPAVLPPQEEWKDYDVVDGKYVNTKPEVRCLKVTKEESDKLLSLLKSLNHDNK